MAFGNILSSLFIKLPLRSTALISRQPPRHPSPSALGGSRDNTFQKTRKQVIIIKGF